MKLCLDCSTRIESGSRCDVHRKARQRQRNAKRGGSGHQWQMTIRRILQRDDYSCTETAPHICNAHEALQVDHIVELVDGGTNDDENLRSVCGNAHQLKTNEERRRRAA